MPFAIAIGLLAVVLWTHGATPEIPEHAAVRAWLGLAILFIPATWAGWLASRVVRAARADVEQAVAQAHADRLLACGAGRLSPAWLASVVGFLTLCPWPQWVAARGWPHLALIVELPLLAAVLSPLVVTWGWLHLGACLAESTTRANDDTLAIRAPLRISVRRTARQVRQQLGLVLIPFVAILLVVDSVRLIAPDHLERAGGSSILLTALVILVCAFPWLLRAIWHTARLPDSPLRERLEALAAEHGLRFSEILVWRTGNRLTNAAVSGMLPRPRYVFLSDGLLSRFSDEEIMLVFAHELGHVVHRHLYLRGMAMLAPWSLWTIASCLTPGFARTATDQWHRACAGPLVEASVGLTLVAAHVAVVFAWLSRRLERQADAFAQHVALEHMQAPATANFPSVLRRLARLGGIGASGGWQHGSTRGRLDFLARLAQEPLTGVRLKRQVRVLGASLTGLTAAALGALAVNVLRSGLPAQAMAALWAQI